MGYFGPFFEDFNVGDVIRHRPCLSIDKSSNMLWSMLTLDYTPLYIDELYASHTEFRGIIINPNYLLSIIIGVTTRDTSMNTMAFLGIDYDKPVNAVYPGDTVCVETEVVDKRESRSRPGVGVVTWVHRAYNQKGKLIREVRRSNLVYRRSHAPWMKFIGGEAAGNRREHLRTHTPRPLSVREWSPEHPAWMGRFFEDFRPGEIIVHRLGRTVYQFDNVLSTVISLNTATLHFDEEYMLYHDYGEPVVQGLLVLGIGCGISSVDLTMNLAKDLGIVELKLISPTFGGDTLHAVSEVLNLEDSGEYGIITVRTTVYKDMFNTEVASFTRRLAIFKQSSSPWMRIWGIMRNS